MQVKKFSAKTIVQALMDVKKELGPDAIILSTKEEKAGFGAPAQCIVVAAVSENHLRKKQVTEKKLGNFSEAFSAKSAAQQKRIISDVVESMSDKYKRKNPSHTKMRYADIMENDGSQANENQSGVSAGKKDVSSTPSQTRVQSAVKEAFQSSLSSQFLPFQKKKNQKRDVEGAVEGYSKRQIQEQQGSVPHPPSPKAIEPKAPEQLSWSLEAQAMVSKLENAGVTRPLIDAFLSQAQRELRDNFTKATVEAWVARKIMDTVRCSIAGSFSGIEFFVGPQGMGKTTSLIKVASDYRLNHKKRVILVTTDHRKVAAYDQLKTYGRILNVPVRLASSVDEWAHLVCELEGYDNILVDTPGVSLSDSDEFDFLRRLVNTHGRLNRTTHLVLSAMSPLSSLQAFAQKFQVSHYRDVIFTNIDQTARHGVLLNFFSQNQKPFHSFGISSDIVEGFEWATRERILDLIFKLTNFHGANRYEQQI